MPKPMRKIHIDRLTAEIVYDEPVQVETPTESFQLRRMGPANKKHHYQVWHAFAWPQDKLTQTQWRNCGDIAAAIQLMRRYSKPE
jgi:hypothetical protein